MESLKRLIGGLVVVSAVILAVLVAWHPAVAARASAASAIDSGSSGTSTSTACCTSDGPSPGTSDGPSPGTSGGPSPGTSDGASRGTSDGPSPGTSDGPSPGTSDGPSPGTSDGPSPGTSDGPSPGTSIPTSTPASTPARTPGGTPPTGRGVPIALVSGTSAGLPLVALFLVWAFTSHARKVRRHVRWVNEHLRVIAGSSPGLPSAEIRPRSGARSVSLGLEPHDDLGNQKIKED